MIGTAPEVRTAEGLRGTCPGVMLISKDGPLTSEGCVMGNRSRLMCAGFLLVLAAAWTAAGAETNAAPQERMTFTTGGLAMTLQTVEGGIRMQSLLDLEGKQELLAQEPVPLFKLALRAGKDKKATLEADKGWKHVSAGQGNGSAVLTWESPLDDGPKGLRVIAKAAPDGNAPGLRWSLQVEGLDSDWSLWDVAFPQVALRDTAAAGGVLYPGGPGELMRDLWAKDILERTRYGGGWANMQFMAAFATGDNGLPARGFYFAMHDPMGSTKEIVMQSRASARDVRLSFEHPVPDQGLPANRFVLPGDAVWRLFTGDWFDAAQIYKAWVKSEAGWWPALGAEGRADTPLWMRELCAWAQIGGDPKDVVPAVKAFAKYLDVPVGFHWYCWHQIPFDNDYPHYFPTKEGFTEAVRELQDANVFVMPYINGRLWDTRDKGIEDLEFTKIALPAATKDEDGKPRTETYGSKESDGSKVTLAVMCPTTPLWQHTVKDLVLRLQNECGVKGVYLDQIAAAPPVLCMDKSHGHPLGGGCWWNSGYWTLLDGIRQDMAKDRIITTECNGEPFVSRFDGYLTWHWQDNGQVPAFPAVYGGAVQMFGRSYGGGTTRDLALRMRAGQQLTFGEQIGWLDPKVALDPENAPFFKQSVQLRWLLRRYFYAGEMLRPPALAGEIPSVKADWQWGGEDWVTTSAVLTGAWTLPAERKTVLIFANVSDAPVTASLDLKREDYGLGGKTVGVGVLRDKTAPAETFSIEKGTAPALKIPARSVCAWEFVR